MAIGTDSTIRFWGTQDEVTSSAGTLANDTVSANTDIDAWTNDDDAPNATATLKYQFDTTMPTAGSIDLYCVLENVQSTNDEPDPDVADDDYSKRYLGSFTINKASNGSPDVDYYDSIEIELPAGIASSQDMHFFIFNNGTSQTIGTGWQLWITPWTYGPHG